MKIIFLDVDGVLNYSGCRERTPQGYYFVCDDRLERLAAIIAQTDAKVVLSSSWRKGYYDAEGGDMTPDAKDFFLLRDKLLEYDIAIIGYTPMFQTPYRGSEILYWLEHEGTGYDIESILILDDDKDMSPLTDFLVRTSFFDGLQPKDVEKSVQILNSDAYEQFKKKRTTTDSTAASGEDAVVHGRVKG